jgi:DNA modification methylase
MYNKKNLVSNDLFGQNLHDTSNENSSQNGEIDKRNKLNDLSARDWIQETKSFFYQRGLGVNSPEAKYEKMHPAPFSFTDIAKLIRFFTKKGGKVLDPFVGVGSTIKACLELDREGFGVELSREWCNITKRRLLDETNFKIDNQHLICGDSRNIRKYFEKDFFDFIITSPPYWNILVKKDHKAKERVINGQATKYSDNELDLGNISDYDKFLGELSSIFIDCHDLLKLGKYLNIIVSDFRHKSEFVPFHADLINKLTDKTHNKHFHLKGIKVLIQNAKKLYPYGYPFSYVENIHHQYILILQK